MNKLKKTGIIIIIIITGIILSKLFIFSETRNTDEIKVNKKTYSTPQPVVQPEIPEEIYFCGERVPLEFFDVREALDNELVVNMYRHSSTIMYLKRANRYFPEIEKLLAEHNIHDDMKYLCLAESGLLHVVSPSGAEGFWQFLERTGKEYGLEINANVDERYNHTFSLVAATQYLHKAYERFGTWSLAAAGYNMGMTGLQRQINRQNVNSYWDLHLNPETARYVYRIIALKIILSNPEKYGFNIPDEYLYNDLKTNEIIVDTTINDLIDFAFAHGTNYKMLRHFNPWIRGYSLPNRSGKEYIIRIPSEGVRDFKMPEENN